MTKRRRKHPGVTGIAQSIPGTHLLHLWVLLTGQEGTLEWEPLEALRDKTTVFLLRGPRGAALLLERKEQAVGADWHHQWGLYSEDEESGTVWAASLDAYRWDPWLHAEETGDRSVADAPPTKRRAVTKERSEAGAAVKDRLEVRVLPLASKPEALVGVEMGEIRGVLEKHGVRLGRAGAVTTANREADPYTGKGDFLSRLPELTDTGYA